MIWSFTKAQLIYVAAKLEIADRLKAGPKDAQALAHSIKINPQNLYRLMRGLAWCGLVVHLADDRFSLTSLGECLQTEYPDSLHENALSMGELDWPAWGALLQVIETGKLGLAPEMERNNGRNVVPFAGTFPYSVRFTTDTLAGFPRYRLSYAAAILFLHTAGSSAGSERAASIQGHGGKHASIYHCVV